MKIKAFFKNPKKFNLLFLSLLPVIFIMIGIISFSSEQATRIFFAADILYGGFLLDIMNINYIFSDVELYLLTFIFSALLLIGNIIAWRLYKRRFFRIYKCIEFIEYIIWTLIFMAVYFGLGIIYVCSPKIVLVIILYMLTLILLLYGMKRTAAVRVRKNEKMERE